ncbi:MAG: outer membrane lipoprotein carrier protein LolA [Bacteroidales bacterium]|nr:outer membrane lipoprotein carrier protein LolA [Bacteroidales bacterium]
MKDLLRFKWLLFVALLFAGSVLQAKNSPEELLKKTLDKMTSLHNFKANLSYTMDNKQMNIHEKKTGTIFVEGDKFRIELEGQIIISDGKNVWTIIKDSKEVMLTSVDPTNPNSFSPTSILKRYVDYKARFEKHDKDSDIKTLVLTSKKETTYKKLTLVINESKLLLKDISLYDKEGNVFTYHISDFRSDLKVTPGTFTFRPEDFPGYGKPEDMR